MAVNAVGDRTRFLGAAALTVIPVLALIGSVWPDLHAFWVSSDAYSHGYLILSIGIWLGVREFRHGPPIQLGASWLGCVALAGTLLVLLAGQAADVLTLQQLALPALPVAALWAATGGHTAKRFAIPAAYCIFAVPVWDLINEPLRALTTTVVGQLTYIAAIPAYIQGNTITIPSGTFEVEGGCSGLRYFIVACALSGLYGLLIYRRWAPRLGLLAVAAIIALVANWVRVFVIIIAGYLTEMQHYLVTVDHYYFGWVLFFVAMLPLFVLTRPDTAPSSVAAERLARHSAGSPERAAPFAAATLLLVAGASLAVSIALRPMARTGGQAIALPAAVGGWAYDGPWDGPRAPSFAGSFRSVGARYRFGDDTLGLYLADYPVQRQGHEVVFYANLPQGQQAEILRQSTRRLQSESGASLTVKELIARDPGDRQRLIWYAYTIAGIPVAGELSAKLMQVLGALRRRWDAQLWVVSAPCAIDTCERARSRLGAFVRDASPHELAMRSASD